MIPRSIEQEITALAGLPVERRQAIRAGLAFDKPAAPAYVRDVREAKRSRASAPRASLSVALSPTAAVPRRCDDPVGWAVLPAVIDRVASLRRSNNGEGKAVQSVEVRLVSVEGVEIAIVGIHGVLTRWGFRDDVSGSSEVVADVLRQLAADDSVRGIVLDVDSPGGSTGGIANLADAIHDARQRKPTVAIVNELAASGAYWVASQASAIFAVNSLSRVGSIGAYVVLLDFSKALENHGIVVNVFRSGPLKGTGIDTLTDPQRKALQRQVDDVATIFKSAITRGRGLDGKLLEGLSTGEVYSPVFAKSAGLIDGILSLNEAIYIVARSVKGVTR